MPYLNVKARVLETKIVYYGAGLSGKTTNLEQIKARSSDGRCGEMMSLNTDGDRTLFFDWLPFEVGKFNGCDVKVQLYTVPGQAKYAETRKRVLAGADGIVLVLDSESAAIDRNQQTVKDLWEHLESNRLDPEKTPIVVQLNKRDLPNAMSPEELLESVGLKGYPSVEAVAFEGKGVFETLREGVRLVMDSVRKSVQTNTKAVDAGERSGLDGDTLRDRLHREVGADGTGKSGAAAGSGGGAPQERPAPAAAPAATTPATPTGAAAAPVATLGANGPGSSAGGATAQALAQAPASAAVPAKAQPAAAVRDIPTPSAGSSPEPARSPRPASDAHSADAVRSHDVVAAQRSFSRRLDSVEATLARTIRTEVARLQDEVRKAQDGKQEDQYEPRFAAIEDLLGRLEQRTEAQDGRIAATSSDITTCIERSEGAVATHIDEAVSRIRAGLFTSDETHQLAVSISSMITDQVRGDLSDLEARLKERSETVERRVSEALEQLTQAQQKDQKELTTMLAALKEGTQTHQTELRKRVDMVGQVLNEGQKTSGKRLAYIANKLEPIEKVAERVQTVVEETVALKTSIESVGRAVVQQKAAGERSESLLTKLDRQLAAVPEMLRQQWSESVEPALDGVAHCSQSAESAVASVSQSVARHSSTSEEWFNRIFEQVNTLVEMAQQEPKANKWWRKS